ncbi:Xaa-Pro aminopeptidase [Clostridia bacterium]|nr:Xaa-Pro aminopeptidase [Clostridia bacterium]
MIAQRIDMLRSLMKDRHLDAYLIPSSDYHASEYIGDYFQTRRYMSGFTGSYGTLVVTSTEAGLWTDGRYFIQAKNELAHTPIRLFPINEDGIPTIEEYLLTKLPENGVLGFDGKVLQTSLGKSLRMALKNKKITFDEKEDIVDLFWEDRPALSCQPAFALEIAYSGQTRTTKIQELRKQLDKQQADAFLLTDLAEINWLMNLRGGDIPCNLLVLSFAIITTTECLLFIQPKALPENLKQQLQKDNIQLHPYEEIYSFISNLDKNLRICFDPDSTNYFIFQLLQSHPYRETVSPILLAKAKKNTTELDNFRLAHQKDAIAVTKFMYWLKQSIGKIELDELSAAKKIEQFRQEQADYLSPSFETISAYGEHGAICHYSASEQSNIPIQNHGLFLVDSGGHYLQGTTDITRTFVCGKLTDEQKKHFTFVVSAMLRLLFTQFLYGCSGINLDILAREIFWKNSLNFNHGTGHGVGYLLNVHESPNFIGMRSRKGIDWIWEEGMITSNEPGLYFEGKYGIRIENLMVCRKAEKNEFGQFMRFECLCYVPIDLDGIDVQYMNAEDRERLNFYHQEVYKRLLPDLPKEMHDWLKYYTRTI